MVNFSFNSNVVRYRLERPLKIFVATEPDECFTAVCLTSVSASRLDGSYIHVPAYLPVYQGV